VLSWLSGNDLEVGDSNPGEYEIKGKKVKPAVN